MTKYSYELLLKPADELPEDVNPELREVRPCKRNQIESHVYNRQKMKHEL